MTVTATTTLAEGVDLPFRFTILADWLTWDGTNKQRPMASLLFRNIAGRCGRAGVMTEGDTIIFDNPVGDPIHTNPFSRQAAQLDLYVNAPKGNLQSGLGSVNLESSTDESMKRASESSSHSFWPRFQRIQMKTIWLRRSQATCTLRLNRERPVMFCAIWRPHGLRF